MRMRSMAAMLVAAGALAISSPAQAAVISPGGSVTPTPTDNTLTGTVIKDTGNQAFSFANDTGTVREAVIQQANGTLCFAYQVTLTGLDGSGDIARLTGFNFKGFTTDVTQSDNGLSGVTGTPFVAGTIGSLSADRSLSGQTVGFNFDRNLFVPGNTSFVQVICTNATRFTAGTIGLIDGGGQTLPGFAPTAIPEPATVVMALAGLPVLGLYYARRRRTS